MILDDEALVERVARALCLFYDEDWDITQDNWRGAATAAIEAVRVHMWDDGR